MADEEMSAPSIGEKAESILCVGVFGDADDDFEVAHKFSSKLPVPLLGGALEFAATKGHGAPGATAHKHGRACSQRCACAGPGDELSGKARRVDSKGPGPRQRLPPSMDFALLPRLAKVAGCLTRVLNGMHGPADANVRR
jgi:hypothetical protein